MYQVTSNNLSNIYLILVDGENATKSHNQNTINSLGFKGRITYHEHILSITSSPTSTWAPQAMPSHHDPREASQSHSPPLDHTCVFSQGWRIQVTWIHGPTSEATRCDQDDSHPIHTQVQIYFTKFPIWSYCFSWYICYWYSLVMIRDRLRKVFYLSIANQIQIVLVNILCLIKRTITMLCQS